jgi:hypothetical protein
MDSARTLKLNFMLQITLEGSMHAARNLLQQQQDAVGSGPFWDLTAAQAQ